MVNEFGGDSGSVHKPLQSALFKRFGLGHEGKHRQLALGDHRAKIPEHVEELIPSRNDPLMVEGHEMVGVNLPADL